jgi:hypothetical protein
MIKIENQVNYLVKNYEYVEVFAYKCCKIRELMYKLANKSIHILNYFFITLTLTSKV